MISPPPIVERAVVERRGSHRSKGPSRAEPWVLLVCRVVLAVTFLAASLEKISNPAAFAQAVSNYRILPPIAVNFFSIVLPWVELLCGLLLLAGQWTRSAAFVSVLLFCLFSAAVSTSLVRGLDIHCGCFDTTAGRKVGVRLLLEDSFWLLLSCLLVFRAGDGWGWRQALGPLVPGRERESEPPARPVQTPES